MPLLLCGMDDFEPAGHKLAQDFSKSTFLRLQFQEQGTKNMPLQKGLMGFFNQSVRSHQTFDKYLLSGVVGSVCL